VHHACCLLEVSRSAYYERRNGVPSDREVTDTELTKKIVVIHIESKGTYGSPRIHKELGHRQVECGRRRVSRLMRIAGLEGRCKKRWRTTTVADPAAEAARDLIQRQFQPCEEMDRRYVGDITYIATWEGWAYLATVIDLASRKIVGWAIADHMRTELITGRALDGPCQPSTTRGRHFSLGPRMSRRIPAVVATPQQWRCLAMGVSRQQRATWPMRGKMRSPGRPPAWQRDQRQRFWIEIAKGTTSEAAAAAVGVASAVGTRWFREAGGMRPVSLSPLSGRYLSLKEREEIAILKAKGCGVREIARQVRRSPSTISRELRRNAATRPDSSGYRATTAQWHADRRAKRPKASKLASSETLRDYVQERLAGKIAKPNGELVAGPDVPWIGRRHGRRADRRWAKSWSPEQIANRLEVDFPNDGSMRISHEAIYQALYVQGRGSLRRELTACLRTGRALRVPRARTKGRGKKFITPEIMISERPAEVADRAVPGHWEGDLIIGLNKSAIGTLVERTTRFTLLLRLPPMEGHGVEAPMKNGPPLAGHGAEAVRDAIAEQIMTLPEQLRRSLTWDQGSELAQHAQLRIDTGLAIYFCDPHSPWQRGTNENTNGLLRQYFPKGTDLSRHSHDELHAVALALNTRPRKTLGWKTPAEALDELLISA
jgi:IS30 family transposase